MKPKFLFIYALVVLITNLGYAQRVGVVLSGGGAKGLSHIGTLKALEENNIPIDFITGSSMGAIVGAMYAAGYSPAQIEKIALGNEFQNWVNGRFTSDYSFYFQKSNPSPSFLSAKMAIDTSLRLTFSPSLVNDIPLNFALLELFSQATAAAKDNFDNLFIPFRCMASDIVSQTSLMLKEGSLAEAVRASMTVPLIYRPIKLNDQYVFDGGIYNNFPADVMHKEFAPDIIIGANVSAKNFNDYPKDDDRILSRFLLYMFVAKSDSTLVGKNGIYLAPDLSKFSSTNFLPVKELIAAGYNTTMAQMEQIKATIKKRVVVQDLLKSRSDFNLKKSALIFRNIYVHGVNYQQSKYIERLFKSSADTTFKLEDIKRGYYKLVADEVFETVYPKILYDKKTDSYDFEIIAQPKSKIKFDFGGNISTRPISTIYLGLQYNYLTKKAYTFTANFYSGRFYESAQLGGRVDFSTKMPLFLQADLTYNSWDYYNTSRIFVENPNPTYIDQADRKISLRLGMPLNRNAKFAIAASFVNNSENYSPTNSFTAGDILDRSVFNGLRVGAVFEKNSLNRKQYATNGKSILLMFNYFTGEEIYKHGNIQANSFGLTNLASRIKNSRTWFQGKASFEDYRPLTNKFVFGYTAEFVASNQPLYTTYYATLLAASAFYPLQDSRSTFVQALRAHNYASVGVKNIFNFARKLDFRLEGYVFLPYQEFKKVGIQGVAYHKAFSKWCYAGTAGFVHQSPLGPISLSYNIYDDAKFRHRILLHFGYLLYNKRSLE